MKKTFLIALSAMTLVGSSAFAEPRSDFSLGGRSSDVLGAAQRIERTSNQLVRVLEQERGRRAHNRARNILDRLEGQVVELKRRLDDRRPGGDFRWRHVGDYGPAQCAGTPQAGDGNPHIVRSPEEAGHYCSDYNVGETFCDAGHNGSRYLDRHWRCEEIY